ncbi:myosin heavy chain-related protein [Actinidia rufa]|uniref:Myosin heavy chain-related protein n=1 Tax=Actinidia rufa TaxID=165716 RepID=A0A7J0ELR2_9ERIC|nr:myosin heavy chain-related protein [Actinidia rufa]
MQQHLMGGEQLEEELRTTKEQLGTAKEERDRALDELREMKIVAREANMKLTDALKAKESLSDSTKELNAKEKIIEALILELKKAKEFEVRLAQRDESFDRLKAELSHAKAIESRSMGLLSEGKRRIQELEEEVEGGKLSETKLNDSLVSQTKQFEQTKIELEELKLEVASLRENLALSAQSSKNLDRACNHENVHSMKEEIEGLRSKLQLVKVNLHRAQECEEVASSKAKNMLAEMNSLKSELKMAIDAEEKSRNAMDDLALALKEVATEANQAKENLSLTELELEHVKQEVEHLKGIVRSTEERYKMLLEEAERENERYKNTIERLRLEAEESILAWNDKEIGFVNCIKRAEEERAIAQQENVRLMESIKATANLTRTSREENFKLRDILKQALNEANVAKEAAGIAKEENSQLKDSHNEKDEVLDFLTRENERLRINEAAAHESIKELKRLLSMSSKKEVKTDEGKKLNKAFSFDLSELKIPNEQETHANEKVVEEEDPVKAEALKGSIFDTVDSPKSEPHTPFHRRVSSSFTDDGETIHLEDLDHSEGSHFGDEENERNSQRKSKALLWRFGGLLKRKGSMRKELSLE